MIWSRRKVRKAVLNIHKWTGLAFGTLWILIGLTGSAIVFTGALMSLQFGDLVEGGDGAANTSEVAEISRSLATVEGGFEPIALYFPDGLIDMPNHFAYGLNGAGDETILLFDETKFDVSHSILLEDVWADFLIHLHIELLTDGIGRVIISIAGISLCVTTLISVYLWWPARRPMRKLLRKPTRKLNAIVYWSHSTFGILGALLLFILGLTGTQLNEPGLFRPVASDMNSIPANPSWQESAIKCESNEVALDEAVAFSRSVFPDAYLTFVQLPGIAGEAFAVRARQPGDFDKVYGDFRLWIEPDCREGLRYVTKTHGSTADRISLTTLSLHSGRTFGLIGRWAVLFLGLILVVMGISGFIVWWQRRALRKRTARP